MDNDFAKLAYESSLRALDKQEQLLTELRARTGLLLAASSLAASFLGGPALERASAPLLLFALLAFGVSTAASVYVLLPRRSLVFSLSGPAQYEGLFELREEMAEVYRRLAFDLHRFWVDNDVMIARLTTRYQWAAVALGVEIVLLLGSVGDTL